MILKNQDNCLSIKVMKYLILRRQFQEEARTLSQIHDENIAPVLGGNFEDDPWFVVREFSEQGALTQFLQNHVAESSATKMSDIPTLR